MRLNHGLHLAYCTNIHRGETWHETFESLQTHALAVRDRVCPNQPFAIGLRLSNRAARELSNPDTLLAFQRWLTQKHCYIFTMNGFPYGQFHGIRVKEQVYLPDWTSPERLAYTNLLFDLLSKLLPAGVEGSVSTLPVSFKGFHLHADAVRIARQNLWHCIEHIAHLTEQTGRKLHLGLEPEPLCQLESSGETIQLFDRLRAEHPRDPRLAEHLGINYDTCHFAVNFEDPLNAIPCLVQHGIKIGKIHVSSALKVRPTPETCAALKTFADDVYFHQVVVREPSGNRNIYFDLPDALSDPDARRRSPPAGSQMSETGDRGPEDGLPEWRIHFHIPLHTPSGPLFETTNDHMLTVLDLLAEDPHLCSHLEMETYTWEVLPPELKSHTVSEQLAEEYEWMLPQLRQRGLAL